MAKPMFILGLDSRYALQSYANTLAHVDSNGVSRYTSHVPAMELRTGLNVPQTVDSWKQFCTDAMPWIVIGQRDRLEQDVSIRHLIPYTLVARVNPSNEVEYFGYQRGSGVGETRLAGNWSVGIGGHIDLEDVVSVASVVDLEATIREALERELGEELRVRAAVSVDGGPNELVEIQAKQFFQQTTIEFAGFLRDDSNAVGQVHLGIINVVMVPYDWTIECREEELITGGFATASVWLSKGLNFENWSQMLLEELAKVGQLVPMADNPPMVQEVDLAIVKLDESPVQVNTTFTMGHSDTLATIAAQEGSSLVYLKQINPDIDDVNKVYPGKTINLI